jgi:hypothetical protein
MPARRGRADGIISQVGASQSALSARKLQPQPPSGPGMWMMPDGRRPKLKSRRFSEHAGRSAARQISDARGASGSARRTVRIRHMARKLG